MELHGIQFPRDEIADFCQRHNVAQLSLFGSIVTDTFGPDSDIDILVEFPPGETPSLLHFAGMQLELNELLGRTVHLHTPPMLDPRWRDRIRQQARVQYAA